MLRRGLQFMFFAAVMYCMQSFFDSATLKTHKLLENDWQQTEMANFGNFNLQPSQVQVIHTSANQRPARFHRRSKRKLVRANGLKRNQNHRTGFKKRIRKMAKNRLKNKKAKKTTSKKPKAPKGNKIAKKKTKSKTDKKTTKKLAKAKRPKRSKSGVNQGGQTQQGQFFITPIAAVAPTPANGGSSPIEKKPDFYKIWSDKLLKNPSTKLTGEFVRSYLAEEFSQAIFFRLVKEMMNKSNEFQEQGLLAISVVPALESYRILTEFTNEPDIADELKQLAQREIYSYANLSRISIVKQALEDSDALVAAAGLVTLDQILAELKNSPVRTIAENDRSARELSYDADPSDLEEVLPVLRSMCQDQLDSSCLMLDDVQNYLPDAV